jgi:hypothetical protein
MKGTTMSTISTTGSTTGSTQQHSFPTSLALAAASAVVVVGGLTAWGISAAQDDATTAPAQTHTQPYTQHQMCPDNRCLPHEQKAPSGGSHNSRSIEETLKGGGQSAPRGGHTTLGLP